ncbi:MAG: SulP family inorganic anion transporter [Crocinitomicaceae bacterium]|nr:SulP family inorganic anion transporter [Crocinitomicaceae bacterium]MDG1776193.1 SulP family inorganic anion transporter [Crocinitomicaceae bacterium]
MSKIKEGIPFTGLKGFAKHWKNDVVAAISVSLVALPLSLAIAVAAGVPPISGLITAVIGGLATTFFRSSALSINGPAAGLIGVILAAIIALDDGCGSVKAFEYVLAAIMVAGGLQVLIGLFKFGRIAEIFPSTVIHGILASIGIIIFAKQMHVAMGTSSDAENTVGILADIFYKIPEINPFIAIISGIGIILLLFHARISYKVFHFIPAPVWVLAIAVPIVLFYNYLEVNEIAVLGEAFKAPENYLIDIPSDWKKGLVFPDFAKVFTGTFWMAVISINLLSTVITLAGTKAVDKLDPYKRKTNMNRDLVGVGISSIISGAVGGLPIITVIVRSTVNVHNNAKTKWSNFYHGLFILLFVLFLIPVIQLFPKAALAAVLVITGIKLASPRLFKEIYNQGLEQIIFFSATIIITLYRDPLIGLLGGMGITLIAHLLISRVSIPQFIQMILNTGTRLKENQDGSYILNVRGIANFLSMLRLIGLLEKIPHGAHLKIDLSKTRLIDLTFQEKLLEFRKAHLLTGGSVQIVGLTEHISASNHKLAIKSLIVPNYPKTSPRQQRINKIAVDNGWLYSREEQVDSIEALDFEFFQSRPLDKKANVISGEFSDIGVDWEISDIVFDEGAMLSKEVYKTTVQLLHLPKEIPAFVIDQEGIFDKLFDRVLSLKTEKDIDFKENPIFSSNLRLTGSDEPAIRTLFTPSLASFLESEEIYHIESNGTSLIIFKSLRNANTGEVKNMVRFSKDLVKHIVE